MIEFAPLLLTAGLLAFVVWSLFPHRFRAALGRILGLFAVVVTPFNRHAVALRVEGEINAAGEELLRDSPQFLTGQLKLEWCRAPQAAAVARGGDVLVVMRRSSHHQENMANALMAYLPRSVLAVARPYLGADTLRALDFTLADRILTSANAAQARTFLRERQVEPARKASRRLEERLGQLDQLDLYGWLTRVVITEYQRFGDFMYPGAQDERFTAEAEEFIGWLHKLAGPDRTGSLQFSGRFFKVAVVFVAVRAKLERQGLEPYRRRAIQLLYGPRQFDVVHVMARDHNIDAVRNLVELLEDAGLVASPVVYEYKLRPDFALKENIARERAICASLRRRPGATLETIEQDADLPSDTFAPDLPPSSPLPTLFPFHVEHGVIGELHPRRMFGFIRCGEERLFFHESMLAECTMRDLKVGSKVIFRKVFDARRNKHHAETVKVLPDGAVFPRARRAK